MKHLALIILLFSLVQNTYSLIKDTENDFWELSLATGSLNELNLLQYNINTNFILDSPSGSIFPENIEFLSKYKN